MDLLAFSVILVVPVGVLSIAVTVLTLIHHARDNNKWGRKMTQATVLVGPARANAETAVSLLGVSRDRLKSLEEWPQSADHIALEALAADLIEETDTILAGLDDMPLLTLATVEDHADELLELIEEVGVLRHVLHLVEQPPG